MTYDQMYQDAETGEQREEVIKGKEFQSCWNCRKLTQWVSISFEAAICSPECEQIKWNEFWKAYEGVRR